MRSKTYRILAAASVVALIAGISASVVQADTPVTSPRLTELESEWMVVRSESEELGGSPSPRTAINNVKTQMNIRDGNIQQMENIAKEFGATAEALEEIRKEVADASIVGLGDVAQEGGEKVGETAVKRACTKYGAKVAARSLGWISLIGDVVEYGGKIVIREMNKSSIREMLRNTRLQLTNIYELLSKLREDQAADRATVRRLEELKTREDQLFDQMAHERERLRLAAERAGPATRHAVRDRVTDPEGDREEMRKDLEERIKLVEPAPPRRRGVWLSEPTQGAMNLSPFAREVLAAHNNERAQYGAQPLQWNPALEANATAYANQLAQTGRRVHAARDGRGIERENLSQGMLGWNTNQMMASWIGEKQFFTPGTFPNVCNGDWSRCGHYTQMIWSTTTDIGCGMAQGSGFNWLVCRYSPGGNKDGKPVGQLTAIASEDC